MKNKYKIALFLFCSGALFIFIIFIISFLVSGVLFMIWPLFLVSDVVFLICAVYCFVRNNKKVKHKKEKSEINSI